MEDDILTIEEVAKYLRVSDRTVYDWAQKGEIPAGKIGTVWRFKKSEIEHWVNDRLSSDRNKTSEEEIQIRNILSPDRIVFINQRTKHDALIQLSEVLATAPQIKNKGELTQEILKREELMSTAIGRGIAIPHVRLLSVTDLVMAIGVCKKPIEDFEPIDNQPVKLLFMIAAAYNQHTYYLKTISNFTSLFKNDSLIQSILEAKSEDEIYSILTKR
ncbi:MAG: PTS sugar transporter subunit IIA [Treponema sp.]|nr:PTS sugar transporter subunit IIA [Treponema sp.]